MDSEGNPNDKLLYGNQISGGTPQLHSHSKAGVQNGIEKEAEVPGPTHTIKWGAQAKFGSLVTVI